MRVAVKYDAAVRTQDVREAGRLAARFKRGRRRPRALLLAEAAFDHRSESSSPILGVDNPGSQLERRLVAHMPPMAAGEFGDPVAEFVLVVTDDRPLHKARVCRAIVVG